MPSRNTNDPKHWPERAAQMRALALTMKDPEVAILTNDLATDYEKLTDRVAAKKSPLSGLCRSLQQLRVFGGVDGDALHLIAGQERGGRSALVAFREQ
jgi:hypothetical protein